MAFSGLSAGRLLNAPAQQAANDPESPFSGPALPFNPTLIT
jgi:hypothetical protein